MQKPKLLITHDGVFHADELFTIALIHFTFGSIPYERRRKVSTEELSDPTVWVLDQYGEYNAVRGNFDHHQDKGLPATNILVLQALHDQDYLNDDMFELIKRPFMGISEYDVKGPTAFNGFQVSEFIKTFNNYQVNGFETALAIVKAWFEGNQQLILTKETARVIFNNGRSIEGIIRVCKQYPVLWTTMGKERLLVAQDKGQWRLHSADTEKYPIISTGREVFIHTNRFIASYNNQADAIEAAKLTARIESLTPLT